MSEQHLTVTQSHLQCHQEARFYVHTARRATVLSDQITAFTSAV